ncbi:MAG: outer membrane lipoprotein carrier protein LolA [Catalinimonas sp.]
MKRYVWALALLFGLHATTARAQYDPKAKAVLDAVSDTYQKLDAFKANLTRSIESAEGDVFASMNGEIVVSGEKYNLMMDDLQIITDGKTVWSYMKEANEVNISNYDPAEGEITPTSIYSLYKEGYKYVLMSEMKADNGEVIQTIDLEPEDRRSEVSKIRLMVNKKDKTVRKWIVQERGTNTRQVFEINKFEPGVPVTGSTFAFSKAAHPGVTEVDLR